MPAIVGSMIVDSAIQSIVNAEGTVSAAISDKSIEDAITKAKTQAKADGKVANGIALELNIDAAHGTTPEMARISKNALAQISDAGVSSLEVKGLRVSMKSNAPYIEWAYKTGILQGISSSQFSPDNALTREGMAVIMENYAKATGDGIPVTREVNPFSDSNNIGTNCKTAVTAMQQAGVITFCCFRSSQI